jgi:hypothetical protein
MENGNSSNQVISPRCCGGKDNFSNRGRTNHDGNSRKGHRSSNGGESKGRGGHDGKSNHGGSGWGGTNGGNHTRSNQGDKTANHEININSGEDGWGGGETGEFNAAGVNDGWGDGNDNNGERLAGNPNSGRRDSRNDGGDGNARDNNNGNAEGCWGGDNEPGDNDDTHPRDWCGEHNKDPNLNAADDGWGNTDNDNGKGVNAGSNAPSYHTDKKSGNDTCKADEISSWNPNSTDNWAIDLTTEEAPPLNNSSVELNQPYAKPYWASWEAESECVQPTTEPNTGRKRSDSLYIGNEAPLYSIHKDKLRNHSASHQVHHGTPAYYARKMRKPVYLDSMEEPYAVFVFKYRSRGMFFLTLFFIAGGFLYWFANF